MSGNSWRIAPFFVVDDVAATANYYRDTLGFTYERFWGDPPAFCMVTRGGIIVGLVRADRAGAMRPNRAVGPGGEIVDAYVWVDDADALYAELRAKKVMIVRAIGDRVYGIRDFDIEDCNGYRLAFGATRGVAAGSA